jgi:hypothetical protein
VPLSVDRCLKLAIPIAIAVALCALLLPRGSRADAPARAAVDFAPPWEGLLRYAGEFGGFRIAAAAGYQGVMRVSHEELPSPDLVIASPGGIQPPPAPCIAPSADVVRCPIAGLQFVGFQMGAGNDVVDGTRFDAPTQAGIRLEFRTGPGSDRFLGGPLPERWFGGPGNDFAKTGAGNDRLIAGAGNDRMFGGLGIDFFSGGRGRDFARGGGGDDRGSGGPGDDNFRD